MTAEQMDAIVEKLGGEEGALRFLRGETFVKPVMLNKFRVFKTLKLGTKAKNADDFRTALEAKKIRIGGWANNILDRPTFTVVTEEIEVDLVVVSVAELNFKDVAKLKDIFARAKGRGLGLCPNQVGPELRLQYEDQPEGEWLTIGMEPIVDSMGELELFCVGHDGDALWLAGDYDDPDRLWDSNDLFVFVLPRK